MPTLEELIAAFKAAEDEGSLQAALDEAGADYSALFSVALVMKRATKAEAHLVRHVLGLVEAGILRGELHKSARLLSISALYSEVWDELREQTFTLAYGLATKSLFHGNYDAAREASYAAAACAPRGTNRRREANDLALTVARAALKATKPPPET